MTTKEAERLLTAYPVLWQDYEDRRALATRTGKTYHLGKSYRLPSSGTESMAIKLAAVESSEQIPAINEWIHQKVNTQLRRLLLIGVWSCSSWRMISYQHYGLYYEWRQVMNEWRNMVNELADWLSKRILSAGIA